MMKFQLCHTQWRKLLYPLTALVTIGLSSAAQGKTVVAPDITGIWNASGYMCDAQTPPLEKIKIQKYGNVFSAIKIIGDNCVPAGYETFRWDARRNVCKMLGIKPDSTRVYISCNVRIVNKNKFNLILPELNNYTFVFNKITYNY